MKVELVSMMGSRRQRYDTPPPAAKVILEPAVGPRGTESHNQVRNPDLVFSFPWCKSLELVSDDLTRILSEKLQTLSVNFCTMISIQRTDCVVNINLSNTS